MKKRTRAHEAGSIEAGSSISKSIFFANRVDRAIVEQARRKAKRWGFRWQADRASQGEPKRSVQPNCSSQGEPGARADPPARASSLSALAPIDNFVID